MGGDGCRGKRWSSQEMRARQFCCRRLAHPCQHRLREEMVGVCPENRAARRLEQARGCAPAPNPWPGCVGGTGGRIGSLFISWVQPPSPEGL